MASRRREKCRRISRCATSSPTRSNSCVEPTTSVKSAVACPTRWPSRSSTPAPARSASASAPWRVIRQQSSRRSTRPSAASASSATATSRGLTTYSSPKSSSRSAMSWPAVIGRCSSRPSTTSSNSPLRNERLIIPLSRALRNGYERYIETITKSSGSEEVDDRLRNPVHHRVVESRVDAEPDRRLRDAVRVVERADDAVLEPLVAGLAGEVAREHEARVDLALLEVQL